MPRSWASQCRFLWYKTDIEIPDLSSLSRIGAGSEPDRRQIGAGSDPGFELSRSEPDRREPDRSRIGVGSELDRSWIGAHVNRAGRRFEDR